MSLFESRFFRSGNNVYSVVPGPTGDLMDRETAVVTRDEERGMGSGPLQRVKMPVEDMAILAGHMQDAYLEAVGRKTMEVTPDQIQVGDAIEGLGEIGSILNYRTQKDGVILRHATLADATASVGFASGPGGIWTQLVGITRPTDAAKASSDD